MLRPNVWSRTSDSLLTSAFGAFSPLKGSIGGYIEGFIIGIKILIVCCANIFRPKEIFEPLKHFDFSSSIGLSAGISFLERTIEQPSPRWAYPFDGTPVTGHVNFFYQSDYADCIDLTQTYA